MSIEKPMQPTQSHSSPKISPPDLGLSPKRRHVEERKKEEEEVDNVNTAIDHQGSNGSPIVAHIEGGELVGDGQDANGTSSKVARPIPIIPNPASVIGDPVAAGVEAVNHDVLVNELLESLIDFSKKSTSSVFSNEFEREANGLLTVYSTNIAIPKQHLFEYGVIFSNKVRCSIERSVKRTALSQSYVKAIDVITSFESFAKIIGFNIPLQDKMYFETIGNDRVKSRYCVDENKMTRVLKYILDDISDI